MSHLFFAFANPGGTEGGPSLLTSFIPILLLFVIFYFLLIRPQQKKQKQHQEMLKTLAKGTRVVTAGGIHGTVVGMKENIVVLRIADQVTIEINRGSVSGIVSTEDK